MPDLNLVWAGNAFTSPATGRAASLPPRPAPSFGGWIQLEVKTAVVLGVKTQRGGSEVRSSFPDLVRGHIRFKSIWILIRP